MNEFNHSNLAPQETETTISQSFELTLQNYHPFQNQYTSQASKRLFHVIDATLGPQE
jgi:hypothetical protein